MSRQKVDSEMIVSIAASKLSGALPALDGSALTGITGMLKGASDPVVTTNPAGGVGSMYLNTADGEMFVCTDATTDNNVWTNVGGGDGDISPWHYPGATYGYIMGGSGNFPGGTLLDTIQRFAFASATTDAVDSNRDLSVARYQSSATRSTTHGYCMGGGTTVGTNIIDKFAFATANADSTDVGDMTYLAWGQSATGSSSTTGYIMGHYKESPAPAGYAGTINKFSFASGTQDATHIAEQATDTYGSAGTNNQTHIFALGGRTMGVGGITNIQKFSMSSEANSTNVAVLEVGVQHTQGTSSTTHGYASGGSTNPTETAFVDHIQEFNFSTEATAVDVGNLTLARAQSSPQSSETYSYTSGGKNFYDRIDRFAYSNPAIGSTDVGNINAGHGSLDTAGTQV